MRRSTGCACRVGAASRRAQQGAGDRHVLDLGGAVGALGDLCEQPRQRPVVAQPVGARGLHALAQPAQCRAAGEFLGMRRLERGLAGAIEGARRIEREQAGGLQLGGDPGQRPLPALELGQLAPERRARLRIGDGDVEPGGEAAAAHGGDVDARQIDRRQRRPQSFAGRHHHPFGRQRHVGEAHVGDARHMAADEIVGRADLDAFGLARHQEARDPARARTRLGLGEDEMLVDMRRVADPGLGAVERPAAAGARRQRGYRRRVRAGLRFGEQEAAEPLARDQRPEDLVVPGMAGMGGDGGHAVFLGDEGQRRGRIERADGLGDQRHGAGRKRVAALGARHQHPLQPLGAIGLPDLARRAPPCLAVGRDLAGHRSDAPSGLDQSALPFVKLRCHLLLPIPFRQVPLRTFDHERRFSEGSFRRARRRPQSGSGNRRRSRRRKRQSGVAMASASAGKYQTPPAGLRSTCRLCAGM